MNYTLIITLSIFTLVQIGIIFQLRLLISFILGRKLDYSTLKKQNLFSPDVMEVYLYAIEHPEKFSYGGYTIEITGRAIEIWASNQIGSRRFYIPSDENQELVDEMNSKLTYYDKYLLDRLCTAVKEGQTKTLEIFFDIKS